MPNFNKVFKESHMRRLKDNYKDITKSATITSINYK